jgi:hypothetical protein
MLLYEWLLSTVVRVEALDWNLPEKDHVSERKIKGGKPFCASFPAPPPLNPRFEMLSVLVCCSF